MAGAGYKLFNTGDVLTAAQVNTYLQEQTVMVFASAAARTTALSGVLAEGMITYLKDTDAVEKYNGTSWVSIGGNASPLTTKGDLYTYSTTDARLGVGNNGETLVADSSASVGLRYQEPKAGNPILNSAFQIWQRGTSISVSSASNNYTADRWGFSVPGTNCASTVSRQSTSDTTNLPNIQYCARFQRNSGQTGTTGFYVTQAFETVNAIPFAGKTVTLSFYARAGANYSPTSSALKVYLLTGTGTDQPRMGSNYTGEASPINTTATLTTTWQRFSYTGTIATTATEFSPVFEAIHTGTAGANDYFELTGVQLEVGSVATPFKTYAATLAGELAACQRYYQRLVSDQAYGSFGSGHLKSTTSAEVTVALKTTLRTTVASASASGNFAISSGADFLATSTLAAGSANTHTANLQWTVSGATAGRGCVLVSNNTTTSYIELSAEL